MTGPTTTILITTRNRRDDLRQAIASALRQEPRCEVLVVDDASSDGAADMVREEFPGVRLEVSPEPRGYIVQRNLGARLAAGQFVFSIDDDAILPSPHIVRDAVAGFDDARVGVVAVPFIDVNITPGKVVGMPPAAPGVYCTRSFIGTAHALRRDLFLSVGGYREALFHFTEEIDLSIRLLDRGYVVRVAACEPIHHLASPKRVASHAVIYRARNRMLWSWWNVPLLWLPLDMTAGVISTLRYGLSTRRFGWAVQGLIRGFMAIIGQWRHRASISLHAFRVWRQLRDDIVDITRLELPEIRSSR